ncbi:hypothetical protein B0H65DRAFT_441886 [Neurospora tetraspora]|uniref:Uncharacterized protein n=1 Tax=Neurospora tetraspora TaxID=94610 RepID=A0AAE0JI70_9PEZI|nr:hypothetical protein B0H65DRAFT_441886 [Neurospora tetraspora]
MDRLTQKELDCLLALREMKLAGQSQTATAPGTDNHADQGDSNQPHHMADKEAIQPIAHQGDHDRSQPGSNTSSTPSAATSQTKTKATKTESNQVKWKVPQWIIDEQNSTADFFLRMYEVALPTPKVTSQQSKGRISRLRPRSSSSCAPLTASSSDQKKAFVWYLPLITPGDESDEDDENEEERLNEMIGADAPKCFQLLLYDKDNTNF